MHRLVRFCSAVAAALVLGLIISGSQPVQAQGSTTVVISEFRTRGPLGASDEFVELTNVSASPVDISGYLLRRSNSTGTINTNATVPASTVLPPGGHFLFTNITATTGYSLANYGGTGAAAGDATYTTGITDDGIAVTLGDGTTIIDQVGMSSGSAYGEGTRLAQLVADTSNFSYVRKLTSGLPQDTNNNAGDFVLVSTDGNVGALTAVLGAPGPENRTSPVQRNASIKSSLLDPQVASTAVPNRVRSGSGANPTNAAFGTLQIRRKFTNNTGAPVTRLRFRIVDITTLNSPVVMSPPQADLRALNAVGNILVSTSGGNVTVENLQLEAPSDAVTNGGGLNSTLAAGTITSGTPLANGSHVNVNFTLGVQVEGNFRFFVNVEALPGPPDGAPVAGSSKAQMTGKARAAGSK